MESLFMKLFTMVGSVIAMMLDALQMTMMNAFALNGANTFELFMVIFPSSKDFADIFMAVGLSLVFIITALNVAKSLLTFIQVEAQNPIYLMLRAMIVAILVTNSFALSTILLDIGTIPYKAISEVSVTAETLNNIGSKMFDPEDGLVGAIAEPDKSIGAGLKYEGKEAVGNAAVVAGAGAGMFTGASALFIVINIMFMILFAWIKLVLEIVERYVILCLLILVSPLCVATAASATTRHIFSGWFSMMISQIVLMSMSLFFLKMFTQGFGQVIANMGIGAVDRLAADVSYSVGTAMSGVSGLVLGLLVLFAWLRTGQRVDAHMSTMGFKAAQAGGGLGADLFMGLRGGRGGAGSAALAPVNKLFGTNYKSGGDLLKGEAKGAIQGVKNMSSPNKQSSKDSAISSLLKGGDGNSARESAMSPGERRLAKKLLEEGEGMSGEGILDEMRKGSKLGSHEAVGKGVEELFDGKLPEGMDAIYGSIDGETGEMALRLEDEDGNEIDLKFTQDPQGEGSVPIRDSEGNLWWATAQGTNTAEFLTGNSNDVDSAEGADAAEYAGGAEAVEMNPAEAGAEQSLEMNESDFVEFDADQVDNMALNLDGELENTDALFNENGDFIGEVGYIDEDGNFVESEDGDVARDAEGNMFQLDEEGNLEGGGSYVQGANGESFQEMLDSGQVYRNDDGQLVMDHVNADGSTSQVALTESGALVTPNKPGVNGSGTGAQSSAGKSKGSAIPQIGDKVKTSDGKTVKLGADSFNKDGKVQGYSEVRDANGKLQAYTPTDSPNASIIKDANGNFQKVDNINNLDPKPSPQVGDSVKTADGKTVKLGADSFDKNGNVQGYSEVYDGEGNLQAYTPTDSPNASLIKDADGNFQRVESVENLSAETSSPVMAQTADNAGLPEVGSSAQSVNGDSFTFGEQSFNEDGSVKTFNPAVDSQGNFQYDASGNQEFVEASGSEGSHVIDSNGSYQEVGFGTVGTQEQFSLEAGDSVPVMHGGSVNLGENSFNANGNLQTYSPVLDADGLHVNDSQGNPMFTQSAGATGTHIQDASGNMVEMSSDFKSNLETSEFNQQRSTAEPMTVDATAYDTPFQAGDTMQSTSGQSFELGADSFDSSGHVQTYDEVTYPDGTIGTIKNPDGTGSVVKDAQGVEHSISQETSSTISQGVESQRTAEALSQEISPTFKTGDSIPITGGGTTELGSNSFDANGNLQTYSPVYDSKGNMQKDSAGDPVYAPIPDGNGTHIMDANGDMKQVDQGAAGSKPGFQANSAIQPGSTIRDTSGNTFQVNESSFNQSTGELQRFEPKRDSQGQPVRDSQGNVQYQPSATGSHVKSADGQFKNVFTGNSAGGAANGFGKLNHQQSSNAGDYVKVETNPTYTSPTGESYAKLAKTTTAQTFEKTSQGFVPSSTGNFVQTKGSDGQPQFSPIAPDGKAGNGAMTRYSKTDSGFKRDNNGNYAKVATASGESQFAEINSSSIKQNNSPQRYSFDAKTQSYVPDARGNTVQTVDNKGNISYSKLDSSTIRGSQVQTFDKGIKGGALNLDITPMAGAKPTVNYSPASNPAAGDSVKAKNGNYYNIAQDGRRPDGSPQTYSKNEASGGYVPDPKGEFVKAQSPDATTPSFVKTGNNPQTFQSQQMLGGVPLNSKGGIDIGSNDKMINNKDGTIDLQFADGRTAKLSNTNMYNQPTNDSSTVGKVKFGNGEYFYQDTSPTYASLGQGLQKGQTYGPEKVREAFRGVPQFQTQTNFGTGEFTEVSSENIGYGPLKAGTVASYVKDGDQYRPATRSEVDNKDITKYVQPKLGDKGFVQGRGFSDGGNGPVREAYGTSSKIDSVKVGNDGNIYIKNVPDSKNKTQDFYALVSKNSGQIPKGAHSEVEINGQSYYMQHKQISTDVGRPEQGKNGPKPQAPQFEVQENHRLESARNMKQKSSIDTSYRPRDMYSDQAKDFVKPKMPKNQSNKIDPNASKGAGGAKMTPKNTDSHKGQKMDYK